MGHVDVSMYGIALQAPGAPVGELPEGDAQRKHGSRTAFPQGMVRVVVEVPVV